MLGNDPDGGGYKPQDDPSYKDMHDICAALVEGDLDQLEFAAQVVDSFPYGKDGFHGTHWIVHAVCSGNLKSVLWMIEKQVATRVASEDGFPPLIACIDVDSEDRYEILAALIAAGADVNARGVNGWTPLHLAAIRDDERAMHMLLIAGADPSIRTNCDDTATAAEEARNLGHQASAEFICRFKA